MLLPVLAWAKPLTQGERDRAMSELHATRKSLLDSIAGLSKAQWNFKPSPERWSIAECAEHILISEGILFALVTQKIMQSPAAPEKPGAAKGADEQLLKQVIDRSRKFKAPEGRVPGGKLPQEEIAARFRTDRDRTIAYVRTTTDDLRAHFASHPVFKELDGYQWLLLIAGHTQRHVLQIQEVKADPSYPKN